MQAVRKFDEVVNEFDPPKLEKNMLVIDGLFGSGLNKPLAGGFASLVKVHQSVGCYGGEHRRTVRTDD